MRLEAFSLENNTKGEELMAHRNETAGPFPLVHWEGDNSDLKGLKP